MCVLVVLLCRNCNLTFLVLHSWHALVPKHFFYNTFIFQRFVAAKEYETIVFECLQQILEDSVPFLTLSMQFLHPSSGMNDLYIFFTWLDSYRAVHIELYIYFFIPLLLIYGELSKTVEFRNIYVLFLHHQLIPIV